VAHVFVNSRKFAISTGGVVLGEAVLNALFEELHSLHDAALHLSGQHLHCLGLVLKLSKLLKN
jgi:hypothetical protein